MHTGRGDIASLAVPGSKAWEPRRDKQAGAQEQSGKRLWLRVWFGVSQGPQRHRRH
jgi:hypothetical protein